LYLHSFPTRRSSDLEDVLFADGKQFMVVPLGEPLAIQALYVTRHPERYIVLDDASLPDAPLAPLNKILGVYLGMRYWNVTELKADRKSTRLNSSHLV